jgi:hypothetical protein
MQTFVEFRSSKFPPYEEEAEEINPGLWGRRLAEYLEVKLNEKGVATKGFNYEDWGCYLSIDNDGFNLALCCGHQYGDDDEFLVFTDPQTPKVRKLFKTIDATPQLSRLLSALKAVLENDPDISEIKWREP